MRERLDYDESLEKSVKMLMKVLIQEETNCQDYGSIKTADPVISKKTD